MSNLQKYFLEFHDKIKLGNFDEVQTLRDKRDILVKNLKENIDDNAPAFEKFDQGSYAMHTGTYPKDGNYDIDVGIVFDCTSDDYNNPVKLKKIVKNALTHDKAGVLKLAQKGHEIYRILPTW
jgi:tRNA nucleotidyltransferase (CCA-adding enzyme)